MAALKRSTPFVSALKTTATASSNTPVIDSSRLAHVGSGLSFFLFENDRGELNVVSGQSKITAEAIDIILTMQGECPYHPDRGLAPALFTPRSKIVSEYWEYHLSETLWRYMKDSCEVIYARVVDDDAYASRHTQLTTQILFRERNHPELNALTFNFHTYQGALWGDRTLRELRNDMYLNGQSFNKF